MGEASNQNELLSDPDWKACLLKAAYSASELKVEFENASLQKSGAGTGTFHFQSRSVSLAANLFFHRLPIQKTSFNLLAELKLCTMQVFTLCVIVYIFQTRKREKLSGVFTR